MTGLAAKMLHVARDAEPAAVIASLRIRPPKGVLVVIGGTNNGKTGNSAAAMIASGVVGTAIEDGLTVVTGGTDAGVIAMVGRGFEGRSPTAPVLGIAPDGLVSWPNMAGAPRAQQTALEPHHTHFVLVKGARWGDETPLLLGIVAELARKAPAIAVLASGGAISRRELLGLVAAGCHVLTLAGTGRLADAVALASREPSSDRELADALATGRVEVLPVGLPPSALGTRIRQLVAMTS